MLRRPREPNPSPRWRAAEGRRQTDMPPRKRAREADADGSITLSSPHEANPLQQALAAQWRKHQFCDITITVEDSSFKAHRCVLAATTTDTSLSSGAWAMRPAGRR